MNTSAWRVGGSALGAALLVAACAGDSSADGVPETASTAVVEQPGTTVAEYPDSITRYLDRLASQPRPVDNSAMPPRHLDADVFPTTLVERALIVSGGPPPDGISPIDAPRIETVADVDWIEPHEPVLALAIGDVARAYPIQVMIWHEIANDTLAGVPVAVTYCPLCNSGVAFDRRLAGEVLDFGTSGALYQANLVMYDRQTESLWTQFDGRAVVGTRVGDELDLLPVATVSWADFAAAHPDGTVLGRDRTNPKPYGRTPYVAYDQRSAPVAGFFTGEPDLTLAPYARVVGIERGSARLAVTTSLVSERGVVETELDGVPITIWHRAGTSSSLGAPTIADGADVGATGVFVADVDGRPASFTPTGSGFVDDVSGSEWNILGEAVAGPLAGTRLEPVVHADTFWFAWSTFVEEPVLLDG